MILLSKFLTRIKIELPFMFGIRVRLRVIIGQEVNTRPTANISLPKRARTQCQSLRAELKMIKLTQNACQEPMTI